MSKKLDKWNSAQGILDELHRIREENYEERQRIGTDAWLKKVSQTSKRLGIPKRRKKAMVRA